MLTAIPEKSLQEKIAENQRRLALQIDFKGNSLTAEQSANLRCLIAAQTERLAKDEAKAARRLNRTAKPKKTAAAKRRKTVRNRARKAA